LSLIFIFRISKLVFKNEYYDNWHYVIDFFLFDHVEALIIRCCKKVKVIQVKNLLLKFEMSLFSLIMFIIRNTL